ncbi:MAG: DUF3158 family protein [Proteobacteria bacterium]|nr:DUF3158 family protein [Pseudomonadota bacterium]
MMRMDFSGHRLPQGLHFEPLRICEFSMIENARSLNGLLKPFNGKGMEEWANESRGLNEALAQCLLPKLIGRMQASALQCLDVELVPHTTRAGTVYLRWRKRNWTVMNETLFERTIGSHRTPSVFALDLYLMEMQRIAFNMQMRATNQIATLALNAAAKMAKAESLYLRRIQLGAWIGTAQPDGDSGAQGCAK